jgi:hypothetical protein
MRNRTQKILTSAVAISAILPSIAGAQARPTTTAARGPGSGQPWQCVPTDSANRIRDTTARARADSASFGIGGARSGPGDIILFVGVHADEVKFASQPHVRVRLCWGGDTLRVVQRDNLPSPIVPGTTYRNVYIAVELIGRLNAECLADRIGVRTSQQPTQANPTGAAPVTSASQCAFLGAAAGTGAQNARPPTP